MLLHHGNMKEMFLYFVWKTIWQYGIDIWIFLIWPGKRFEPNSVIFDPPSFAQLMYLQYGVAISGGGSHGQVGLLALPKPLKAGHSPTNPTNELVWK